MGHKESMVDFLKDNHILLYSFDLSKVLTTTTHEVNGELQDGVPARTWIM
jgi:hypothetical protein